MPSPYHAVSPLSNRNCKDVPGPSTSGSPANDSKLPPSITRAVMSRPRSNGASSGLPVHANKRKSDGAMPVASPVGPAVMRYCPRRIAVDAAHAASAEIEEDRLAERRRALRERIGRRAGDEARKVRHGHDHGLMAIVGRQQRRAECEIRGRIVRRHREPFDVESFRRLRVDAFGAARGEAEIVRAEAVAVVLVPRDKVLEQPVVAAGVAQRCRPRRCRKDRSRTRDGGSAARGSSSSC